MAFSLRHKRQAPQGRYTPNLWPVWLVAPLALAVAVLLGWGIYQYAYDYFTRAAADQEPVKPVNINDVIKATVTALTLIGAVLAGLYAYRKQLLSEGDAHRADASQLADRYTTAAEQLGHDQAAVRLAGVYALARLADDWAEQRQVCIDVLCAYLRMPYEPDSTSTRHKEGEREVRHTIIRVIRDHLRQPDSPTSWCTCDLDFTGATFDGGDLSGSRFHNSVVSFDRAVFSASTVSFDNACFSDGAVSFTGARFIDGTVSFTGAKFSGADVSFAAEFSGATVLFDRARFTDGTVFFDRARFSGSTVLFTDATFSGSTVSFGATFSDGTVSFDHAGFSGGAVSFGGRLSDGTIPFYSATFSGAAVSFNHARFDGATVPFGAVFSDGRVSFDHAWFSDGTVSFEGARFDSGTVTFDGVTFDGTVFVWGHIPRPTGA